MSASDQIKMLSVYEGNQINPIAPSVAAVKSGEYVVARPLNIYTNGEPQGLVKTIIDFCLSEEGQKIVGETGYVPVN